MFFFISFEYGEYLWSWSGKEPLKGTADFRMAGAWGAGTGACGMADRSVPWRSAVLLTVKEQLQSK